MVLPYRGAPLLGSPTTALPTAAHPRISGRLRDEVLLLPIPVSSRLRDEVCLIWQVLASFCGALCRYAEEEGRPLKAETVLRALVAVSLPEIMSGREPGTLYNHFVMPSLELRGCLAAASRADRLAAVRGVMGEAKVSMTGWWVEKVMTVAARLGLDSMIGKTQVWNTTLTPSPAFFSPRCETPPSHSPP